MALSSSEGLNKAGINIATRMCEMVIDQLVITADVQRLYESANAHAVIDDHLIRALTLEEEEFLSKAMDYVEANWTKSDFNVRSFSKALGYTYAQLYGRLMKLTGATPNNFIKEFRLHKALVFLHNQSGSIAEIAAKTGFSSASYFSKCFLNKYGVRPYKYLQQHS